VNPTPAQNRGLASSMGDSTFEGLKHTNEHGAEYWSARDLQAILGYTQWRRFEQAIERAQQSCGQSGNEPRHHFAGAGKMIKIGKGGLREVPDFNLSRFAFNLSTQNGDPRKPEVALAQNFSAVQTRRQKLGELLASDLQPFGLRKQAVEEFKTFSGAGTSLQVEKTNAKEDGLHCTARATLRHSARVETQFEVKWGLS
jgi:DNA-damage-inducible protein D